MQGYIKKQYTSVVDNKRMCLSLIGNARPRAFPAAWRKISGKVAGQRPLGANYEKWANFLNLKKNIYEAEIETKLL